MRAILRTNGDVENLPGPISMAEAARLIGADTIDTVALHRMGRPLHVMLVDDRGWETEVVTEPGRVTLKPVRPLKPINAQATAIYLLNCKPGTTHQIVGDVVVMPDDDRA